jgi:hypothetical protein
MMAKGERVVMARDRATREIGLEALAMAKCGCPGLAVRATVGWWWRPAWDEALWLFTAAERLGRGLQALAWETPFSVEDLERRALIRQGYRAALR